MKIPIEANPKCKLCLGSALAITLFADEHVCPCVTEQLKIATFPKNYKIPAEERYEPGRPEFVSSEEIDASR